MIKLDGDKNKFLLLWATSIHISQDHRGLKVTHMLQNKRSFHFILSNFMTVFVYHLFIKSGKVLSDFFSSIIKTKTKTKPPVFGTYVNWCHTT